MIKALLLCLLAGCTVPVTAQLTRWTAGTGELAMGKRVSLLEDKGGTLTIDSVAALGAASPSSPSASTPSGTTAATTSNPATVPSATPSILPRFAPSTQSILHFGFTESIFWLHFSLDNPSRDSLVLELDHAFIPTADLYTRDGAGRWIVQRAGYRVPLGSKPVVNAAQVFPLPPGRHDFYLRLQPYVHAFPVNIWEKSHYHVKASREKLIFGIYAGLLLFAIAINLFLFYTFRRSYYFKYALLVFFYTLSSALVMEGYAVYFFPGIDLMFWYRVVPVLDMPALIFYCLSFLEVKRYDPGLYKLCRRIGLGLIAYVVALPFLPLLPVLAANQVLALGIFVLAITIGLRTGRRGNKLGYYFVTAYAIWFVLINLELVYIQTGRPPHPGPISYVSFAIFIESVLLAWLLVQRFRWERQADQRRQAEMQAHINKMHREFQHAILSSKLEIQEQTFQQISQEIHDNIGQILSLVKLHIATMDPAGDVVLENKIRDSKTLVTKAIHDLRNLSHRLHTGYINEVGFHTAVMGEMETIRRTGAYNARFSIEGRPVRFDPQQELILFRIVQELLNNILKHAHARTISVELNYNREGLLVMVQDDGRGFDRSALERAHSAEGPYSTHGLHFSDGHSAAGSHSTDEIHSTDGSGLGIKSMYHRASLIGADFQLTSSPGSGTMAAIHIAHPLFVERRTQQPVKSSTL